ncbi:MAG: hypothetical protein BWX79_03319 [Alphaproteobacteria bacterium ADurb.Bin100]|nr:MAG: hypothetical protein BWX79_03319 [Alphaproteobacteria bacterium ADurb.Bin100]
MGRTAGKGLAKVRERRFDGRQQACPDAVAGEPYIGIAGVFHPCLAARDQPVTDSRAGHRQQRAVEGQAAPLPASRHGRQAGQARAARQGQQDGLDLIVRMLGNRNVFDSNIGPFHAGNCLKSFVSCLAGGIFGACAAPVPRVHPAHGQWHTQACAQRLAVQLEAISRRLKAMVNVHGAHLPGPFFGAGQQQRGGICAAAERNRQGQAGMECSQCLRQGLAHGGSSGAGGSRARGGLTCCRPWCR